MTVQYTDSSLVTKVSRDKVTRPNPYADGYGSRIPTPYRLHYKGRMHRVYVMCYGNAGSAYIRSMGADLFLDIDTEYSLLSYKVG